MHLDGLFFYVLVVKLFFLHYTKFLYKATTSTGDYCGQMNSAISQKWVREKLISNLLFNSVINIDNASYHSIQTNKPLNVSQKKEVLMDWLSRNNISFCPSIMGFGKTKYTKC